MSNPFKVGDTVRLKPGAYADDYMGNDEINFAKQGNAMVITGIDGKWLHFNGKTSGWNYENWYPCATQPSNTALGAKHDSGKPLATALFRGCAKALQSVLAVLTFGAAKYKEDSWRTVPDAIKRYEAALGRHWLAFNSGQEYDDETGLPHLAHIATNAMFLLELRVESGDIVNYTKFTSPDTVTENPEWFKHDPVNNPGLPSELEFGTFVDVKFFNGDIITSVPAGQRGAGPGRDASAWFWRKTYDHDEDVIVGWRYA